MTLLDLPYEQARRLKYEVGRKEHRQGVTDEFQGDPVVELYHEMLDAGNYLEEMQRKGIHVPMMVSAAIRSCAAWARDIRQT